MKHKHFHTLRWIAMTISFLVIVLGIRLFGQWFRVVDLPVFSCSTDDQIFHSYCYYLSHLNELFEYETIGYIVTYFLTFVLLAVLFGRMFCGFICPMGYLQDIAWKIREVLHIEGMSRKEKFMDILKTAKYVILFVFVGIAFLGFDFCDICPAVVTTYAFSGFTQAVTVGYVFTIILFVLGFFMRRFWCNICPMGYLVGLFHKISVFRLKKDNTACTKCGACYESCPMRIKSIYTESEKTDVTTAECIFCGECIKKCPENYALSISIGPWVFYTSSRKDFEDNQTCHRCTGSCGGCGQKVTSQEKKK